MAGDYLKGKPLVSIYGTVYNNRSMLKPSLDSIIGQFPDFDRNFEMVMVDNYSSDGTYEVLKEYAAKHRNIKLIRKRCTRGQGREIGFRNTTGKYIFYVDPNKVYFSIMSKLVYGLIKKYEEGTVCLNLGFVSRKTMERIGGWWDCQSEDVEFSARAITKGVRIYGLPIKLCYAEVLKGGREKRYAKGFALIMRRFERLIAMIRGDGLGTISDARYIRTKRRLDDVMGRLLFLALLVPMRFMKSLRPARLSKDLNNVELVWSNMDIEDPSKYGIPRKYWLFSISRGLLPKDIEDRRRRRLVALGLDRHSDFGKNMKMSIFFTENTSKSFIKNEKEYGS